MTSPETGNGAIDIAASRSSLPPPTTETDTPVLPQMLDDDCSSSLSEAPDTDSLHEPERKPTNNTGDADSEAETERIEESPQKQRRNHNIVLSMRNNIADKSPGDLVREPIGDGVDPDKRFEGTQIPSVQATETGQKQASPLQSSTKINSQTPEVLGASTSEHGGRKRKRSTPSSLSPNDDSKHDEPATKRTGSVKIESNGTARSSSELSYHSDGVARSIGEAEEEEGEEEEGEDREDVLRDNEDAANDDKTSNDAQDISKLQFGSKTRKKVKGKAKNKRIYGEEFEDSMQDGSEDHYEREVLDDDQILEPAEEAEDADAVARNEEDECESGYHRPITNKLTQIVQRKQIAQDILGTIEKQFATFREKWVNNA